MRTKRLALGKETLGDLTPGELTGIAGGTGTLRTCCVPTLDACVHTVDFCIPTGESVCYCS